MCGRGPQEDADVRVTLAGARTLTMVHGQMRNKICYQAATKAGKKSEVATNYRLHATISNGADFADNATRKTLEG